MTTLPSVGTISRYEQFRYIRYFLIYSARSGEAEYRFRSQFACELPSRRGSMFGMGD